MDVIKHGGKRLSEEFSEIKLHASIMAACRSVRTPEGQAESIANSVCKSVVDWLQTHPEVTSADIRIVAHKFLQTQHPDAAYLYEQHRITL